LKSRIIFRVTTGEHPVVDEIWISDVAVTNPSLKNSAFILENANWSPLQLELRSLLYKVQAQKDPKGWRQDSTAGYIS
jgi:hypothetical protein